jgi:hypothetical protein
MPSVVRRHAPRLIPPNTAPGKNQNVVDAAVNVMNMVNVPSKRGASLRLEPGRVSGSRARSSRAVDGAAKTTLRRNTATAPDELFTGGLNPQPQHEGLLLMSLTLLIYMAAFSATKKKQQQQKQKS